MTERNFRIYRCLLPLSYLYGWGVSVRNWLYDWNWKKSKSFQLPVICVGNLSVGGTGKTPHTEYLIRLLQSQGLHVATLSRGYKRSTRGYLLAHKQCTATQIGDEPCQMKRKFPEVQVAVDENRCHGIEQLMQLRKPAVDVVLLDDAFQHRAVKAGLNILLTDFNRLCCDDCLLPAGRLREPAAGMNRAQIVIVTKCPDDIKPIDFNIISKKLNLYPYQKLFFSGFRYGRLQPLDKTGNTRPVRLEDFSGSEEVLLVTGIASPAPLVKKVKEHTPRVKLLAFDDHHDFTARDLKQITEQFMQLKKGSRYLITTEKDAVRLAANPHFTQQLKAESYLLPVEIEILQNQQDNFNQNIIGYVRAHSRNGSLPQR